MAMAGAATNEESFMLVSSVRGHHVYKRIWTPVNGQLLQVQAEAGNPHDSHAVSTVHGDTVVGHMPRDISRTAFYFIQHGGRITCEVTGCRKPSDVLNKGLIVPCIYMFHGKPNMIKKLVKLLCKKDKTAAASMQ